MAWRSSLLILPNALFKFRASQLADLLSAFTFAHELNVLPRPHAHTSPAPLQHGS